MTKKIVVTGGSGRFGSCLKNTVTIQGLTALKLVL